MAKHADIYIAGAVRTAIGNFNGSLKNTPASALGAACIQAAIDKVGLDKKVIDDVIMGQVLAAGVGQNPARQAMMAAGLNKTTPAMTINQVCGSGLRAVAMGYQSILSGDSQVVVAGGQENMTLAPHCAYLRGGLKMGDGSLVDTMIRDGLWDYFNDYHMGVTAENIAKKWKISRDDQDQFALISQQRAEAAIKANKFQNEIIPVNVFERKETVVFDIDEFPRAGSTIEALTKLRPAFDKKGSVTAGNASGINDGAAACTVLSADAVKKYNITPMARIVSWATVGVDPALMGSGPIPASKAALKKAGWKVEDLDVIEANEAFAAQSLAVVKDLGLDPAKVNVNGGAIALGHPIGASGCRVLVTLLHEMKRRKAKKGLVTLCIGGGMGIAMCVEAV